MVKDMSYLHREVPERHFELERVQLVRACTIVQ